MKFSKRFFSLVLCFLMVATLVSCKEQPVAPEETTQVKTKRIVGYQALSIGGGSDSADGEQFSTEYDLWSLENRRSHQDESAPSEMTVVFEGKEYTGAYSRTELNVPKTYKVHRYNNFEEKHLFSVHSETGELMSITFAPSLKKPYPLNKEQCMEAAENYAKKYIDLSTYQTEETEYDEGGEYMYTLRFYREIGGYRTNDVLIISVNGVGEIISMEKSMLGSFDGITEFQIDEQSVATAIEEKIDSVFQEVMDYKGSEVYSVKLIRLPDGSCALFYVMQNAFDSADNHSHENFSELLVIPIYETITE